MSSTRSIQGPLLKSSSDEFGPSRGSQLIRNHFSQPPKKCQHPRTRGMVVEIKNTPAGAQLSWQVASTQDAEVYLVT